MFQQEDLIRDFFIVLFTPIARRLSRFNPNTVTLISVVTGVLAGISYGLVSFSPILYIAAGILVALSGAADSLDGIVARMYGRTSTMGDFLDHLGDRLVEVAIFLGLAFTPGTHTLLGIIVLVLLLLNAYLGTQIEASFGERYYGGGGKAELFVALVTFSFLLFFFPDATFPVATLRIPLTDIFFILVGASTIRSFLHRLFRTFRMNANKGAMQK